jgi:uncharacterized phage protein (TIGR01671 family)
MREILFRGKVIESDCREGGEWVYGYFVYCADEYGDPVKDRIAEIIELDADRIYLGEYSSFDVYKVDPETVGQWTGLVDKNGVKIFEGDIVKCSITYDIGCYPHSETEIKVVVYRGGSFNPLNGCERNSIEVIGNQWDNPELVK